MLNKLLLKKLFIFGLAAVNVTAVNFTNVDAKGEKQSAQTVTEKADNTSKKTDTTEKTEKEKKAEEYVAKIREEQNTFNTVNKDMIFKKDAFVKESVTGDAVKEISKGTEGKLVGENAYSTWKIEVEGQTYYVNTSNITTDADEIHDLKVELGLIKEEPKAETFTWNGPVLSASAGCVQGPSGRETYYNLPMEGVVSIMRSMGNTDPYWVREDGVKMLGNYVMVAAHLGNRPRGSLVPCSLGMAIVCDTGGFAAGDPNQLDIATAW